MISFQALFVAGEHCDRETMEWASSLLQKPVLDNWWQTGKICVLLPGGGGGTGEGYYIGEDCNRETIYHAVI